MKVHSLKIVRSGHPKDTQEMEIRMSFVSLNRPKHWKISLRKTCSRATEAVVPNAMRRQSIANDVPMGIRFY